MDVWPAVQQVAHAFLEEWSVTAAGCDHSESPPDCWVIANRVNVLLMNEDDDG